ncbi:MAG: hypothetical protein NG747_05410 [Candidatus Brocadia sp.]|nr:hypothetical protein [Candidatus Brocadia sp.]
MNGHRSGNEVIIEREGYYVSWISSLYDKVALATGAGKGLEKSKGQEIPEPGAHIAAASRTLPVIEAINNKSGLF